MALSDPQCRFITTCVTVPPEFEVGRSRFRFDDLEAVARAAVERHVARTVKLEEDYHEAKRAALGRTYGADAERVRETAKRAAKRGAVRGDGEMGLEQQDGA